jgi:prevent-host-death family protein
MVRISIDDIQRDPTGILRRVETGETLRVTRSGKDVAEIKPVPTGAARQPRPHGLAAGEFVVPIDFNAPLPDDILDAFEGK